MKSFFFFVLQSVAFSHCVAVYCAGVYIYDLKRKKIYENITLQNSGMRCKYKMVLHEKKIETIMPLSLCNHTAKIYKFNGENELFAQKLFSFCRKSIFMLSRNIFMCIYAKCIFQIV